MDELTQEDLHDLIEYDPNSGIVTWLPRGNKSWDTKHAWKRAGTIVQLNGKPYRQIRVFGRPYQEHRLIWLYVTGEWPKDEIDHEDHDGLNNQWNNLRGATRKENMKNLSLRSDNSSGITGVYFSKSTQKWRAQKIVKGKTIHIGLFENLEDAARARKEYEINSNFHANHGVGGVLFVS